MLSIIVVSYNCKNLVLECLASLASEGADTQHEVILVDNCSSDGTADAVASAYSWVKLHCSTENLGFARANNVALNQARGDTVLLLNPDTVVPVGTLAGALRELNDRPEVGMLGCKLVRPDGSLDHACKRGFPTPLTALAYFVRLDRWPGVGARLERLAGHYVAAHLGADEAGYVDAVNGAFMLCRRTAIDEVGDLDEAFWMYGEDLDWCYRFWQRGWRVLYWPGATVVHVKGGSSGSRRSWSTNRAFHLCMWRFYRKHQSRERNVVVDIAVLLAISVRLGASAFASFARSVRQSRSQVTA